MAASQKYIFRKMSELLKTKQHTKRIIGLNWRIVSLPVRYYHSTVHRKRGNELLHEYSGTAGQITPARTRPILIDRYEILAKCVRVKSTVTSSSENLNSSSDKGNSDSLKVEAKHPALELTSQDLFGNYKVAYGRKSTLELLRVLSFFFLCRFTTVTDNALKIMEVCYRVFGQKMAEFLIKKAVYEQFVAGETADDVKRVAQQLRQGGMATILCVPMETDDQSEFSSSKERFFDGNLEKVVASIHLSTQLGDRYAMTQFKLTALLAGDLLKTISPMCAQTTHNSKVINELIAAMSGREVDFTKLPDWATFPKERTEEFMNGLRRLGKIRDVLENQDVIVLVDAEYTSMNPALRLLTLCLMNVCNREYAKVFYTYQAYLKATRKNLEEDLNFAQSNGFGFGVKLVRGAYIVAERQYAREIGYECPVNETFDLTTASYNSCLDLLLEQVSAKQNQTIRFIIASHNEDTVRYALTRMRELGINKDGPCVFFGQLYGMADHLSFTLGNFGYRVYKSIPYGSVTETVPYLARRAQENKAVLINARRERKLVAKALRDRLML